MENEVLVKSKKKHKFLKVLFIIVVVIGIIVLALGFIFPGLLWNRDLGVDYSKADYDSILEKLSYIKDDAPSGDLSDYTYKYGEVKDVDVALTSSELTAFFNYNRPSSYPLKNVQVRVNSDGTIDAVGVANVDYFLNEFLASKYSKEEIESKIPLLGILPNNVNLSLKFSGMVTNNNSSIDLIDVRVQGISVPSSYINSSEAISAITTGADKVMDKFSEKTGSSFTSISAIDSAIKFIGKVPSSLERIKND